MKQHGANKIKMSLIICGDLKTGKSVLVTWIKTKKLPTGGFFPFFSFIKE